MFGVTIFWQSQLQVSNICHVNNIFRTRCCPITNWPIDLKLGINIRSRVMHVSKERFFKIRITSCNLTLFTCWPSEALQRETQEPSASLAKLIRSCHTDKMFINRVQT